jgi:hypothetical protein
MRHFNLTSIQKLVTLILKLIEIYLDEDKVQKLI